MREFKLYAIPGDANTPWNPEIHGLPYDEESELADRAEIVPVDWKPGEYGFEFACHGGVFRIFVPEDPSRVDANPEILRGFHEFLKVALNG